MLYVIKHIELGQIVKCMKKITMFYKGLDLYDVIFCVIYLQYIWTENLNVMWLSMGKYWSHNLFINESINSSYSWCLCCFLSTT